MKIPLLLATSFIVSTLSAAADITTALPNQFGSCNSSMYANCDGTPDQAQLELSGTTGAQDGNWDDLSGGVTNRPYVQRLSLINGTSETVLISEGTTSTTLSNTPGSVGVIISPTNLCDSTETPGTSCYSTPNRISLNLVYRKQSGEVGYNFSLPNDGSSSGSTGNSLSLLSTDGSTGVTIDQNTIVDLTVALNTLGTSLRWTWLNGIPTYWNLSELGQATATIRVKFRLASMPAIAYGLLESGASYCSAVPVSTCDITQSHSDWLAGSMILSLDTTLNIGMTGALFATEGAIIGSVDASTDSNGLPRLTYGLSSSHLDHTGATRSSTLRAFIPEAALVQVLGIPSLADRNAAPRSGGDVIGVERVGGTSTVTRTFTEWTEETNGENGLLMTVSGVTFSAPQYRVSGRSGTPRPPTVSLSGNKYRFTIAATSGSVATTCKTQKCKIEIYQAASSKFSASLTRLGSKIASRSSRGFAASFKIAKSGTVKKNTRLLAVVKNRSGKVISSTPITLQR